MGRPKLLEPSLIGGKRCIRTATTGRPPRWILTEASSGSLSWNVLLLLRCVARNVFRKNADQPRFLTRCLVELRGRYSFDKLAMGLKLSRQFPCRPPPTTSQVTKRGIADLALHNLLAIPHRELEHHQIGIIPNGLASRQRHESDSFPIAR